MSALVTTSAAAAGSDSRLTCFVIGPIGDRDAPIGSPQRMTYETSYEVFESIIEPACSRFDLTPFRADLIAAPGEITEQVFTHVMQADIVIADLTGGNPNVMLELGLRYGTGKPTIQISEAGQLPFNVAHVRTIRFAQTTSRMITARKELESALEAAVHQHVDPTAPARILAGLRLPGPASAGPDGNDGPDVDGPGMVDFLAVLEPKVGEMTAQLDEMGAVMAQIAEASSEFAADLQAVDRPGIPKSAGVPVFRNYAQRVSGPASHVRDLAGGFEGGMKELDAGMRNLAALVSNLPPGFESDGLDALRAQINEIVESAATDLTELKSVQQLFMWLKRLSKDLREPAGDIAAAFKLVGVGLAYFSQWDRLLSEAAAVQLRSRAEAALQQRGETA